jgi:hypothetical protein
MREVIKMNFWEWMVLLFIFFPVIAFITYAYLYYCWPELIGGAIIGIILYSITKKSA